MHRAGAAGITELLRFPVPPAEQRTVPCCGGRTDVRFDISRELADAGAQVVGARHFYSSHCRENPPKRTFSKGTPQQAEIQRGMQFLPAIVGKPVLSLYVQMDGTGVPAVKKETVRRHGKTEGQPAHTREVHLGCVFTQAKWDAKGDPIRDPDSTTYAGPIDGAERTHQLFDFPLSSSRRWWTFDPGFLTDFVVGVQTACQLP
jgi:hypothetical protein